MKKKGKARMFIAFVVSAIVIFCIFLLHNYSKELSIPDLSDFMKKGGREGHKSVRGISCEIVSNIDRKSVLQIKMTIPYESFDQRRDLKKKLPKMKNDILTSLGQQEMRGWIKKRDFGPIKTEILRIVNSYSEKPVKDLYFDNFLIY